MTNVSSKREVVINFTLELVCGFKIYKIWLQF